MRDRIAMALSVLTRMGAGLLVFVLMARGLGPESFGLVVTVMAYATLASLVTDFGFASKTLRDIAADRARGGEILNASLNVKIYFTALVIVLGTVAVLLLPAPLETRLAMILLAAAVLIAAIGDLSLTAYRAVGRFASETWLTLWSSAVHLLVIGWIALAHGDVLLLAAAFLVSRLVYAALALRGSLRLFPGTRFTLQPPRKVLTTASGAWSWAVDSGLSFLNGQIDGFIIVAVFGLHAAGIYQAGARFVQGALSLVAVLANIHIPRLSRMAGREYGQIARMIVEFCLFGAIGWVGFWLFGPFVTQELLGPEYAAVDALWLGFGSFVCARYVTAALGVLLIVEARPNVRIVGQLVGVVVAAAGLIWIMPSLGINVAPWIMTAGALSTCAVYVLARLAGSRRPLSAIF
tara:strand:- start:7100 stop:8320 length:1221 start_codon:yes stop_codon:yes gene_type:complete